MIDEHMIMTPPCMWLIKSLRSCSSELQYGRNSIPSWHLPFKVSNRNTKTRCEKLTCLKLTIKTPERHHWRCSGVFIISFEQISHLSLVFFSLTLKMSLMARCKSFLLCRFMKSLQ